MSPAMRWVTFDCFGTLVDWQTGFRSILAPLAGSRVDDVVRAYHDCERIVERKRPHRPYKDVLAEAAGLAARDCGIAVTGTQLAALSGAWGSLRVFADAEPMLAELRRRGWRLAVLTNCDDDLFEVTHRSFRRPFDLFVTAERVRGYKPAPWHFRAFELLTGANRCNWVHVACSWYHDIEPAQRLGIRSVWLDREQTGEDPGATIRVAGARGVPDAVEHLFASAADESCVAV